MILRFFSIIVFFVSLLFCQNLASQSRPKVNNFEDYHFMVDDLELKFKTQIDTVETQIGNIIYTNFTAAPDIVKDSTHNLRYNISYCEYPFQTVHSDSLELLSSFFDASIKQAVEATQGELNYEDDIFVQGFPGKIFRITFNEGKNVVKTKIIIVDNQMYLIQVATHAQHAINQKMTKFLNSFKLL